MEQLQPYVTIEVVGPKSAGAVHGAAYSTASIVHGARFESDWAVCGLAPSWQQTAEACTSHPSLAFLRLTVHHRRTQTDDEVGLMRRIRTPCPGRSLPSSVPGPSPGDAISRTSPVPLPHACAWVGSGRSATPSQVVATEVIPWWCLREGLRVVPLQDTYGSRLPLARLILSVEMRGEILAEEKARKTLYAAQPPPRQIIPMRRLSTAGDLREDDAPVGQCDWNPRGVPRGKAR